MGWLFKVILLKFNSFRYFKPQPRFTDALQKNFAKSLTAVMTKRIRVRSKSSGNVQPNEIANESDIFNRSKTPGTILSKFEKKGLKQRKVSEPRINAE